MTIEEAREHIGALVVYRPKRPGSIGYPPAEEGVITSVNDRWVFVRYGMTGSAATDPADLTFVAFPVGAPDMPLTGTDGDKLRTLADWLDVKYPSDPDPEVQRDLRRIARRVDGLDRGEAGDVMRGERLT